MRALVVCVLAAACAAPAGDDLADDTDRSDTDRSDTDGPAPSATLGPEGGTYDLGDGVTITVAAGAVDAPTPVYAAPLPAEIGQSVLDGSGFLDKRFLGGVRIEPPVPLRAPAVVTLPAAAPRAAGAVPLPLALDVDAARVDVPPVDLAWDPATGRATVTLPTLTSLAVAEIVAPAAQADDEPCSRPPPCTCAVVDVTETARDDVARSGDCALQRIDGRAVDAGCPDDPFTWVFQETNGGCVPSLTLDAPTGMAAGSEETVRARTSLLSVPLVDQPITFAAANGLAVQPTSGATDADGELAATLVAPGHDALGAVSAQATVTYHTELVTAGGEVERSETRTARLRRSATVIVKDAPFLLVPSPLHHLYVGQAREQALAVVDLASPLAPISGVPYTVRVGGAVSLVGDTARTTLGLGDLVTVRAGDTPGPYEIVVTADIPYVVSGRTFVSRQEERVQGEVRPPETWAVACEGTWREDTWSAGFGCGSLCLGLSYLGTTTATGALRAFDPACLDETAGWAEEPVLGGFVAPGDTCGELQVTLDEVLLTDADDPAGEVCTASDPAIGGPTRQRMTGMLSPAPTDAAPTLTRSAWITFLPLDPPPTCVTDVTCTTCYGPGDCESDSVTGATCDESPWIGLGPAAFLAADAPGVSSFDFTFDDELYRDGPWVHLACRATRTR